MPVPCAVLMCHAPIVLPEIGGRRSDACQATTTAMRRVAERLVAHAPDVIVIVSPHAPRMPDRWGVVHGRRLHGDFSQFGLAEVGLIAQGAPLAADALVAAARSLGVATAELPAGPLDHGTLVPLHFLREAGWRGRTLCLSLPYPGSGTEARMGQAIALAAARLSERWAVLASGDMSHRLKEGAPAGFHPRASEFDASFVDHVAAGELREACAIDLSLRDLAAEDVVESVRVAAASVDWDATGHEVVSYEGPFGVGYLEAVLHDSDAGLPREVLDIAREAVRQKASGTTYRPAPLRACGKEAWGLFVTLRDPSGDLRGCMGKLDASPFELAALTAECATLAAFHDPRFPPVRAEEVPGLRVEVSLLAPPEPVVDLGSLDPACYGVVVRSGLRRGLLLPGIEGITTSDEQILIALRKGDIDPNDTWTVERFRAEKVADPAAPPRTAKTHA